MLLVLVKPRRAGLAVIKLLIKLCDQRETQVVGVLAKWQQRPNIHLQKSASSQLGFPVWSVSHSPILNQRTK